MLRFFLPASKVQKDRHIMRETDSRMAKYSRRGVVFNFIAFLVILSSGRFAKENHDIMVILTSVLLVITLLRGFYLFRFDHLYPRAPTKWRNHYFVATLVGAIWWGVILSVVTLRLDMGGEAPLLWLYTVIFFSTTAHAFAPFQRFLSYYQFFGQVPAAATAFLLFTLNGYLYATLMMVFYLALTHQCRLISENYWERLEATYALARKTQSIEEEKRDTKANVILNQEFMSHLHLELSRLLDSINVSVVDDKLQADNAELGIKPELMEFHENIRDFNGVLSKELTLNEKVFNIRHELQHLVAAFIDDSELRGIQIETSLSPTLPMRLKGDASRLAQIIRTLLEIVLQESEKCIVLMEVEFLREYENAGELYVTVTRISDKAKKKFFGDSAPSATVTNLSFVVAKALAELMNGSIEINESHSDEQQFRFNAKVDTAELTGQLDFHKNSFAGHNVLLVHSNPRIVDLKRQELDALGFNVFTETQLKRALQTLQNSYKFQNPIQSMVFYLEPDNQSVVAFCDSLLDHPELKSTRKIIAATRKQQVIMKRNRYDNANGFYYVDKPTGLFELESVFHRIYKQQWEDDHSTLAPLSTSIKVALLTLKGELDPRLDEVVQLLGSQIVVYKNIQALTDSLQKDECQMVLIDCDNATGISALVDTIRTTEINHKRENFIPLLGVSVSDKQFEDTAFELGLDDFVDIIHNPKKTIASAVSYWSSLVYTA
ncbi:MAG: signal transduction histidine kinase [Lentisphaeria bacterium]|jgi:signal transduction histidine kinase